MIKLKHIAIAHALIGCISSGHWLANEYDPYGKQTGPFAGNPVVSVAVAAFWPMYLSYVIFKE